MESSKIKQINTSPAPFYDFFTFHAYQKDMPMPPCWSMDLEIIFIISGEHHLLIDGTEYLLKEKDIVIINPLQTHSHLMPPEGRLSSLTIPKEFLLTSGFARQKGSFENLVHNEKLWNKFRDFYLAYYTIEPLREPILRAILLELLIIIFKEYFKLDENFSENSRIYQILEYLNSNYTENITLDSIAKEFHYNKSYLASTFKKLTGRTLTEYINQNRCHYAETLLKTTNIKIEDIAEMCGFSSDATFRRVYKRHRKTSPSNVRKMHKEPTMRVGTPAPEMLIEDKT